jgi:hypothetical protein
MLGLPGRRRLALARGQQRVIFGARLQRQFPRLTLGVGAQRASGAGAAVTLGDIDLDDGLAPALVPRRPGHAGVPRRARGGLGLPVPAKGPELLALSRAGLPTPLGADRARQIDLRLRRAADQQGGLDVARVHHVGAGQERFGGEVVSTGVMRRGAWGSQVPVRWTV